MQLAETTIALENTPRFYNTITSNCTNELAKNANIIKENTISSTNRALYLPGYADEELYKLGLIPKDMPFEEVNAKYDITETVKGNYQHKDFSKIVRESIAN